MLCRYCSSENSAANAFCISCGKPFGITCPTCGNVNQPHSRFCGRCSGALPIAERTAAADEALRVLITTGGERKHLTLMFADIANSTGLIERYDPEDAIRRIQPVIDTMKEAVDRNGGMVIKVQGDGIMALFGAPRPHEDHALRACAAALGMQAAVVALDDPDLLIRVGMHTGAVVIQAVENSLKLLTYDVAGPAVHLAARMEQMAKAGEILLTADTVTATRYSVETTSLGRQAVRGMSEPVGVFRLRGVRHMPASVIFRSKPRLTKFTGRTSELESLEAELANAAGGEARMVGVVGGAGVGKSRLCFEFAEGCRKRRIHVHEVRVLAHARATPYQPVLELLRDYLGLKAGQGPEDARRQVAKAIAALPGSADTLPLLLDFLGIPDAANPAPKLDPAVRKTRLMELMRNIVRSGPRDRPALILIEDLHWVDGASGEFIEAMTDAVVGTKTLLLFNFRLGYAAPWMQRSHYRQLSLAPLGHAAVGDVLGDLLGRDTSMATIAADIAERAQGNPFFVEELVQTLVERGHLGGERGAHRLVGALGAIPLPATIEAVLAARIDRLDETAKHILQCAAVIGREVPIAILESVSGVPAADLVEPLRRLRRVELLRELWLSTPGLHAFSHPLIQEVCYQSLLRERRRKIHADVAKALKAQTTDPWEERISMLAYHLEEAGEVLEATQATMRSALWLGVQDSRQALASWRKVHRLLSTLPVSDQTNFMRMHTCMQIMTFGWREGMSAEEAQQRFEEAREIALATNNVRANAWIHASYGRNLAVVGSADDYVARVREAAQLAAQSKDRSTEVVLQAVLSQALRLAGHVREALQANIEATEHAHEISEFDRQLLGFAIDHWLLAMRGQILILLGRFDEARPYLDRMLQADVDPNDLTQHLASVAYVDLACAEGDRSLAEQHVARIHSLATTSSSPYVRVNAQACSGLAHMLSGRFDAAAVELEKTLAFARERRAGLENEARLLADLANAYRLSGDLERARQTAGAAIEVACARAARVAECLARIVLAETALASGDTDPAMAELPKVQALMIETGAMFYLPLAKALADKVEAR